MKKKENIPVEQMITNKTNKGGRPRVDDALKKIKAGYSLHFTEEERLKIEKAYKEKLCIKKVSRNTFIIECTLSTIENRQTSVSRSSVINTSNSGDYKLVLRRLSAFRNELKTIGVNLNQLVKRTHFLNLTASSKKEIEEQVCLLLPELQVLIQKSISYHEHIEREIYTGYSTSAVDQKL